MKGLIRNNFYAMEGNLMISFIMAAALVFTPLFVKNATIYPMIIAVQVFLFVVNTGTALHADEVAKWNNLWNSNSFWGNHGNMYYRLYLYF